MKGSKITILMSSAAILGVAVCVGASQSLPAQMHSGEYHIQGGQACACCWVEQCAVECAGGNYKDRVAGGQPETCTCTTNSTNPCWEKDAPDDCRGFKYYSGDECGDGQCTGIE